MGEDTSRQQVVSRIKPTAEFVGGTSILIVLMGVPATIFQYSSLQIPIAYLSYRRMLEAGFLPAILVISLLIYLFWVEARSNEQHRSTIIGASKRPEGLNRSLYDLSLPALPLVIPAILVLGLSFISFYIWIAWSIGWLLVNILQWPIGNFELTGRWTVLLGFGAVALLLLSIFVMKTKLALKRNSRNNSPEYAVENSKQTPSDRGPYDWASRRKGRNRSLLQRIMFPETVRDSISVSFISLVTIPIWLFICTIVLRCTIQMLDLHWPAELPLRNLVKIHLILGIAYAYCVANYSFSNLCYSKNPKTADFGYIGGRFTYFLFVIFCIFTYCLTIYPFLPRSFGGGRPEIVDIVAEAKVIPEPLKQQFSINHESKVFLDDIYLIDKTNAEAIVCQIQPTNRRCFAIPAQSVVSVSWHSN